MGDIYDIYPSIVKASDSPVVLEIGVGTGEDTGRLVQCVLERGKPYTFLAFEPEWKNIPRIRSRSLPGRVELLPVAIGAKTGVADFISSGDWPLSGSLKKPVEHLKSYPWLKFQPPTPVPVMSLDDVFRVYAIERCDFMWIDVQGAEDLVIEGGQNALAKTRWVYSECYSTEEYEGHIGPVEMRRRLPGQWTITQQWGDNYLFKNNAL